MDPILFWNDVALEANRVSFTSGTNEQPGPALSARALAIVHLAMYDAFAAVAAVGLPLPLPPDLTPYLPGLPAVPSGATREAATAGAAYTTLVSLYPSQKAFFDLMLSGVADTTNSGYSFGVTVAQMLLLDRQNDPKAGSDGYVPPTGIGKHKVDPDNPGQGFYAPFYGAQSKLFAAHIRHALDPYPTLGGTEYKKSVKEVRGNGIAPELMGTVPSGTNRRSAEETIKGIFWAYDGATGLGTPPRFYNQIVRALAMKKGNSPEDNARLFALINVAMADAGILAWEQKYHYNLWRPVVSIRDSGLDTGWLPLGAPNTNNVGAKNQTPNFPAYPSGHATFGAAAFQITRLFYHAKDSSVEIGNKPDKLLNGIKFVSEELNGKNRDNKGAVRPRIEREFKDGLWEMIVENGLSRVFLGVHWNFDAFTYDAAGKPDFTRNIGGVPLGMNIAQDIFANGLTKSSV